MKPRTRNVLLALTLGCVALTGSVSAADGGTTLEVTITNLTSGQILSEPVVVSHQRDFQLFTPGLPASAEIAMVAEDAVTGPLVTSLGENPDVFAVELGAGIPPGGSTTVTIPANGAHRWISVIGMLVTTNDAFYSVQGLRGAQGEVVDYAKAWDAGSEANNEDCSFIPGPPCGMPGEHTKTSEGFIHIHNGIHGEGDLAAALFDWRNPVAKVSVRLLMPAGQ